MKKFGLIIFVLLLIVGGAAAALYFGGPILFKKDYAVDGILPEGPVVFVSMKDVETNIGKFTATKFWKTIHALDYDRILKLAGAKAEETVVLQELQRQLGSPENREFLSSFFGQEIAVAVYPMEFAEFTPEAFQELATNIFFVTRLKPKAKFAEFLSSFMSQISPDVKITAAKYKNHTINVAKGTDQSLTIGYVSFGDVLVFGIGDRAAKACVDVVEKVGQPLTTDPLYAKTKADFLPGAQAASYINFDLFVSLMKSQLLKLMPGGQDDQNVKLYQDQMDRAFRQVQGFQGFGYSSVFEDVTKVKATVHFDKTKLDPVIAEVYSCPPDKNQSLAFIPSSVQGYQWNNCYSLKQYWEQVKEEAFGDPSLNDGQSPSPQELIAGMEASWGLSIENDVVPAFGDEFGGALTDVELTEAFPVPHLLFFIETANKEKADHVIETLLTKQAMLQPQSEDYQGEQIKYVTVPLLVTTLEPAYAYLDKYFVLASDRKLLEQAVDTLKGGDSLAKNPKLKTTGFDITQDSNSIVFLDVEQLAKELNGVADWALKWTKSEEAKRSAFKTGGAKRLADLETEITTQETELSTLEKQLELAQSAPVSDSVPGDEPSPEIKLGEQIAHKKEEIQSSHEKADELRYMIGQYSQPAATKEDVQIMETFVKPLLKSFQFFKVVVSTTNIKEGVVETMVHLKVE